MRFSLAILLLLATFPALASDEAIRFDAVITHDGKIVSSPSLIIGYGQEGVIEIPGTVRIVALANAPAADKSHVSAKIYGFKAGGWVLDWESAMEANLAQTPSFEHDLTAAPYRIVLMPRKASHPAQ